MLGELTGTGYSRQTVTGAVVSRADGVPRVRFTCDPLIFGPLHSDNGVVLGVLFFHPASDVPIAFYPLLAPYTTRGRKLRITPDTSGLLTMT